MSESNSVETPEAGWSEQRLKMLILGRIEENSELEYKRAAALDRNDQKKKAEISKDVSAFANSSGGTLIYGIAEGTGPEEHMPVALDPVNRAQYSKEWLEQIISSIQPKIEGINIIPVTIGAELNKVCYVVQIPESTTAHQAVDNRYYKRGNFMAEAMKDYELRLVMNRAKHPILKMELRFIRGTGRYRESSTLQIQVRNIGPRIARQYMVEVSIPVKIGGASYGIDDANAIIDTLGNWRIHLPVGLNPKPIFPGSDRVMAIELKPGNEFRPPIPDSTSPISCRLFADEMPMVEKSVEVSRLSSDWQ